MPKCRRVEGTRRPPFTYGRSDGYFHTWFAWLAKLEDTENLYVLTLPPLVTPQDVADLTRRWCREYERAMLQIYVRERWG